MSTQTPITTEPTACSTNWITRLACKLQVLVEPLCEKTLNFKLNITDNRALSIELMDSAPGIDMMLYGIKDSDLTADVYNKTILSWQESHNQTIVLSKEAQAIIAPRLTLWNKLGLAAWKAFSVGTECSCCLGWRVIIGSAVVFFGGFLLGKI